MATTANIYFNSQLPWVSSKTENAIFFKITLASLIFTLLFAAYVMMTVLPEMPRAEKEKLPAQLAQIIQAQEPPPLPPQIEPEPEPKPEAELVEEIPEVLPQELPLQAVLKKEVIKPKPEIVELTQQDKVAQARETAQSSGMLKFADQLASMRQEANLDNLADTNLTQGGGQAEQTARNIIAAPSISGSGGIQTGGLTTNVGAAGELEGRRSTEFVAFTQGEAALATKRVEDQQQVVGNRDLDQIRQTLDANKGAVYSLYRRALRQDPSIEGKLTVKLIIEPDGSLSLVVLVDSELGAPELVSKLIGRIQMINFGNANVMRTELEYAYNFLPF
jgi:protein TonB